MLREGAALVGLGIVLGVPGVWAAGGLVRGLLVGVSPWDLPTLVAVAAGLMVVALLACAVPAIRAIRISPVTALRQS